MPDLEKDRRDAVGLFLLAAVGVVVFGLIHLFEYAGELAVELGFGGGTHEHDHEHLDEIASIVENAAFLWFFVVFYALAIVVPLVAMLGRQSSAAWTVFVLGAILVVGSVLDGLGHAVSGGAWHSFATAVLAVGLPGFFGCRSALRWVRNARAESRPSATAVR